MPERKYRYFPTKGQLYLALLIALIVLGSLFYGYNKRSSGVPNQHDLETSARLAALVLDKQFIGYKDLGSVFTSKIIFRRLIKDENWGEAMFSANELTAIGDNQPIHKVALLDIDGVVKADSASAGYSQVGRDLSYRDYFKGVSSSWQPYVSEIYQKVVYPQDRVFAIAIPIADPALDNVAPIGILNLVIDVDVFMRWLSEVEPEGASIYVVDQHGKLVAHSKNPDLPEIVDYSDVPAVQMLMQGEAGSGTYDDPIDNKTKFAVWQPVAASGWGVVVESPK